MEDNGLRVIGRDLTSIYEDEYRMYVWNLKYGGRIEDVLRHIADELAGMLDFKLADLKILDNKTKTPFKTLFYNLMLKGYFLPGGRAIAAFARFAQNNGRTRMTPMNCFTIPIREDSLASIMQAMTDCALTYALGGGCGLTVCGLRPDGAPINNAAMFSTGAWSFLPLYDATTGTIGQKGRRGALLITLNVAHPDVYRFIAAKDEIIIHIDPKTGRRRETNALENMNISVKITDEFMEAVQNDDDWDLWYPDTIPTPGEEDLANITSEQDVKYVQYISECYDYPELTYFQVASDQSFREKKIYETVKAKKLWEDIANHAHATGDPGVALWGNTISDTSYNYTKHRVHCFNPCGEISLPNGGSCCLAAFNLTRYVDPKTKTFDMEQFSTDVIIGTIFLDALNSYSIHHDLYPLQYQKDIATDLRLIGLGVTGIADTLLMMGQQYDSREGVNTVSKIMEVKEEMTYLTSIALGKHLESYKEFKYKEAAETGHFRDVLLRNQTVREAYEQNQSLRNAQVGTIAPTGTLSILFGTSSGIEPVFATEYDRDIKEGETKRTIRVKHPIVHDLIDLGVLKNDEDPLIRVAHAVDYFKRIEMQAGCQRFIDGSISSTINLPEDTTPEQIKEIYETAYKEGLKGITIFRHNSKKGVLTPTKEHIRDDPTTNNGEILEGRTIQVPFNKKWYITLNHNSFGTPQEIFINAGKSGSDEKSWTEALGRVGSLYLQEGGDIYNLVNTLENIRGKEATVGGQGWGFLQSGPDAAAKAIKKLADLTLASPQPKTEAQLYSQCPTCNEMAMVNEGGCAHCSSCGYGSCE